jgi:cytochrome oxidase Cu insertion factor (SCO1/SenC/PrrC family)
MSTDNSPTNSTNQPSPARSRTQIWILIGVFFAPLTIAFVLYYGLDGWRPSGNTNHGELIQPPAPVPEIALSTPQGAQHPPGLLRDKWTLVYVGSGDCDSRCREALTLMRQTRLALNDDMTRVQRLFLVTQGCCDETYLATEHAGLLVATLDENATAIGSVFAAATPEPLAEAGRIYIVDPLGNLMMSYPRDAEPKGLLQDLKKLLKFSHIG